MRPSKDAIERAASKLWGRVGLPISECMEIAEAAITAALIPGQVCRRECLWNVEQKTGHNYGLIRMEE